MTNQADVAEQVIATGNLASLTAEQRTNYYMRVCSSLGLNPLTRPFEYITLNGKLTLYARKDATDQLRDRKHISIGKPDITFQEDWIIVTVSAHDPTGREDSDVACVSKKDMRGDFGNAVMKAVTKAKRRVTLSICGLGLLDETEVETIPDVKPEPPVKLAAPEPTPPVTVGEKVLASEPEVAPGIPNTAVAMLEYVNKRTNGHYAHPKQMSNALKQQWPDMVGWPGPDDVSRWAELTAYLIERTKAPTGGR